MQSIGFNFDQTNDEGIICTWLVPPDYDDGGSITIGGWFTTSDACLSPPCVAPGNGIISWESSYRTFTEGDSVTDNWTIGSGTDFTVLQGACGLLTGRCEDVFHNYPLGGDPGAVTAGDLVFYRIRRMAATASDNVNAVFHLNSVRITYDTTW